MEIKGVKYAGPIFDNSGYAKSCRGNIMALYKLGIPLTLNPMSFESAKPDLGKTGQILNSLVNKNIDYNVNFIHSTPEFWEKYKEKNVKNIGYTVWETTKIHHSWPDYINTNVDKVIVMCNWNKEVFKKSGVTIPIGVVQYGIDMDEFKNVEPYCVSGIEEDTYIYYSIFQWVERKCPLALIKAYWYAFQNDEKVALVLKTYRSDYSEPEKQAIRTTIKRLKSVMPMDKYPPIYLISHMLSEEEIFGLHKRGDCCVSLDRGEGWGLSPFVAGAEGNPLIVTGFGGATEYAKEDNSYLNPYTLTPCFGMPWSSSSTSLIGCVDKYKEIKDVDKGTLVFNKNGNIKKVIKVGSRPMLEDEHMHVITHYSMPTTMEVTNKHKLYIFRNNKIFKESVKNITLKDYLVIPKPALFSKNFSIDMLEYVLNNRWIKINNRVVYDREQNKSNGIYRNVKLSEELFYLIGLYLAEGCVYSSNDCVSFAFNLNEKNTLGAKCIKCIKKVFGIADKSIYTRDQEDRNGYEIIVNNTLIGRFFKKEFNTGSHNKSIPYRWRLNSNIIYRQEMLKGYWDGDGHIRKKGVRGGKNSQSPECVVETVSKDLCLSFRDLLLSLDIVPSIRKAVRKDGRISYISSISNVNFDLLFGITANRLNYSHYKIKIDDNYFAVRVKSNKVIKNYKEYVYSMSVVPDDNEDKINGGSYILNGIASSNSPWYNGNQLWAEPSVYDAAKHMQYIYENQNEAKEKGLKLKKYISENFTWEHIGKKLIKELEML